ncbi:hypothetical protein QCB45_08260 [Thiomicrorhabdus sp. ZW0627]|uniref:LolA-related protein n=1 Tax=Thiomicrorhabdus sp. ZW0627 TaxID=3039774 RepID=UPI0024372BA4|nr:LolA-related protein [Thiomicrorhabdus sp. ZW0627]MDG6774323.1 hypothetical protein [Thiomicrorhabdus sp. ZW0627]
MPVKQALLFGLGVLIFSIQSAFAVTKEDLYQNWPLPAENQSFTEERYDALLELKSVYRGVFHFYGAQSFEIEYQSPIQGSLSLKDSLLSIDFPQRKLEIGLSQLPEVAQFLLPLQSLMSGHPQALEKQYQVSVESLPSNRWRLILEPRSAMSLTANRVTVTGKTENNQSRVLDIQLDFKSGDWRRFELSYE